MIMPEFSPCPACGAIAEITDRFVLASTDGPVDHLALSCVAGHHFRMPADSPPADGRTAPGRPGAADQWQRGCEPWRLGTSGGAGLMTPTGGGWVWS
jgi:hypothetical protein